MGFNNEDYGEPDGFSTVMLELSVLACACWIMGA
jgi:hypothetical protein